MNVPPPAPGVEPAAKAAACEATPFAFAVAAASGLRFLAGDEIAAAAAVTAAAAFMSAVMAPAALIWSHGRLKADASEAAALFSCCFERERKRARD